MQMLASLNLGPIEFLAPIWLLLIPVLGGLSVWIARQSLSGLASSTRIAALVLRLVVISVLAGAMAEPQLRKVSEDVAVNAVIDASRSVPTELQQRVEYFLAEAAETGKKPGDRLGTITVARDAIVQSLPSKAVTGIDRRFVGGLDGTDLASGIQLALATSPTDAAARIILFSDGLETSGSLLQAAEAARAAGVPIDVMPLRYRYDNEVIVDRVVTPGTAREGETLNIRVVLTATQPATGRLTIMENGVPLDLDPDSASTGVPISLDTGTNVLQVPVPVYGRGAHEYQAVFEADRAASGLLIDQIVENNTGTSVTFVSGEGRVLILRTINTEGIDESADLVRALQEAGIRCDVASPDRIDLTLTALNNYDAVVMVNQDAYPYSYEVQDVLRQYVHDTGGGLVMVGGDKSFGAGGWIGSPLADALPIRLDPPQKRQMPRGALALIIHSVEIPRGVFYGKQISNAAVDALSRLDLVGIVEYQGLGGTDWVYPMSPVGDRTEVRRAINNLQFGDMPSFDPSLQLALAGLQNAAAGQKHCIIISDGDPSMSRSLLRRFKQSGITISTIGVNPHSAGDTNTLRTMARMTGGTYYFVSNNALATLPQIFIKEAQTIRRALIWEGEAFAPTRTGVPTETMRGISGVPPISGYVVAAEREGLSLVTLRGKEEDPIAAQWQYGLGKVVTFTSDVSSRWSPSWVAWSGFNQYWEQHVRWAMRPGGDSTLRVTTENVGERTRVIVEAFDPTGERMDFANFRARASTPDGVGEVVELRQVGPGRYEGDFDSSKPGSYVVNMQYRSPGKEGEVFEGSAQAAVIRPFADEYKSLKTNLPLLQQVASITGGRVLDAGDPVGSDLWTREGLTMPVALTPIWMLMAIVGIGIFLLDVAVRRVRIDPRAIVAFVQRGARKEVDRSMDATAAMRMARVRTESRTGDDRKGGVGGSGRKFEADDSVVVSDEPVALSGQEEDGPGTGGPSIGKPKKVESKDDETIDALSALRAAKKRARDEYDGNE